ncbi:hypothetical protein [Antarctobacter sp.]|uniref:hypothetical protein n=1 Tax=Antarctobacter sp. TaxID=1872577 RepID=UPI003A93758A
MATAPVPNCLKASTARVNRAPAFRNVPVVDPRAALGHALIRCLPAAVTVLTADRGPDRVVPEVPDIFVTARAAAMGALAGRPLARS